MKTKDEDEYEKAWAEGEPADSGHQQRKNQRNRTALTYGYESLSPEQQATLNSVKPADVDYISTNWMQNIPGAGDALQKTFDTPEEAQAAAKAWAATIPNDVLTSSGKQGFERSQREAEFGKGNSNDDFFGMSIDQAKSLVGAVIGSAFIPSSLTGAETSTGAAGSAGSAGSAVAGNADKLALFGEAGYGPAATAAEMAGATAAPLVSAAEAASTIAPAATAAGDYTLGSSLGTVAPKAAADYTLGSALGAGSPLVSSAAPGLAATGTADYALGSSLASGLNVGGTGMTATAAGTGSVLRGVSGLNVSDLLKKLPSGEQKKSATGPAKQNRGNPVLQALINKYNGNDYAGSDGMTMKQVGDNVELYDQQGRLISSMPADNPELEDTLRSALT